MTDVLAEVTALNQRCMFGTQFRFCGDNAVWHVMATDKAGTEFSMVCANHWLWWTSQIRVAVDFHKIGHVCGIPDAIWQNPSAIPGEGACVIEWGGDLHQLIDAKEMALTG